MIILASLLGFIVFMYLFTYGLGYAFKGQTGGSNATKWLNSNIVFPILDSTGKTVAKIASKHPRIIGFIIVAAAIAIIIVANEGQLF